MIAKHLQGTHMKKKTGHHKKLVPILLIMLLLLAGGAFVYQRYFGVNQKQESISTSDKDVRFETKSEWTDTYRLYVMYPATSNAKINESVKAELDPIVNDFKAATANANNPDAPYDLNLTGEVNFATPSVLNLVYRGKQFTGGADVTFEQNRLFNRATGERITTASLFKDHTYLTTVSALARQQLPATLGANYSAQLAQTGTEPTSANFDQFEIDKQGNFVVLFKPGQVANESVGTVKITVPVDTITPLLKPASLKLFPEAAQSLAEAERKAAEAAAKAAKEAESAKPQQNNGKTDCTVKKCVALTFDDGPGVYTAQFLDLFKKYDAKVTYFVIGRQVPARTELVARAAREGHDIGIHTWDHPDIKKLGDAEILSQVNRTNQAIVSATGKSSYLFRPPYGSYNPSAIALTQKSFVMWSVDPEDWKYKDPNTIYQNVMANTKSGSVVLSHSIYPATLEAYKRIIPDLIQKGYTLVTVSDMFNIDPNNPPQKVFR